MIWRLLDLAGHPFGVMTIAALSRQHGIRFGLRVGAEEVGSGFLTPHGKGGREAWGWTLLVPALGVCRCSQRTLCGCPTARSLDTHPPLNCNDLKDLG